MKRELDVPVPEPEVITASRGTLNSEPNSEPPARPRITRMASPFSNVARFATRSKMALALCDQGVLSGANFLTGVAIGRIAGKTELGLYALCWTIVAVAFELSSALITAPYTVFSPQMEKSETKRYLGSMLVQQAALSLVVSIIMLLAMAMAAPRGTHTWVGVVITTAAVIPFLNLREFVRRVCFAELNVTTALVIDAITAVAQLGGIYFLALTGRLTAVTTYALLGGVSFAVFVGWLFVRRDQLVFQPEHWMPTLLKNWAFAKWVLASGVLWTMATYVYPWILTAYDGVGATGVWAACSAVVALGNPVFGGLGSYISPKVVHVYAQSGTVAMRRYVYRSSLLLAGLLLPLICVLLAWGDRVISHLYGASYGHNGTVVTLLAFNLLLTAFTYPYSRGLFTLHAARADMFVNMVAIGLLFSVGITAIKLYGLRGAAVALLLSTGVTAAIRMAVFVWVASSSKSVSGRVACEAETSE